MDVYICTVTNVSKVMVVSPARSTSISLNLNPSLRGGGPTRWPPPPPARDGGKLATRPAGWLPFAQICTGFFLLIHSWRHHLDAA